MLRKQQRQGSLLYRSTQCRHCVCPSTLIDLTSNCGVPGGRATYRTTSPCCNVIFYPSPCNRHCGVAFSVHEPASDAGLGCEVAAINADVAARMSN